VVEAVELAEVEVLPKSGWEQLKQKVVRAEVNSTPLVMQPPVVQPVQLVNVNLPATRKGNSLAIAALVLGIIAALICWIPLLGLLAIPVALLGALLGVIGLILALIGRRSGLSSSIVGTAISLGSIVLAVVITGKATQSISEAFEKARKEQMAVAKPVADSGQQNAVNSETKASDADDKERSAAQKNQAAPTSKTSEEWVIAPTPAKLGDVIVKVRTLEIDRVPLKGIGGEGESKEPLLMVTLEITNTNANRKIDYKTWAGRSVSFERDFATLEDNNGNSYKRISFGFSEQPIGRYESESIYPEKVLGDILVFETPIKTADHLDLELPAKNVGEKGSFRIRIPANLIEN
jgi:hypothetical protein